MVESVWKNRRLPCDPSEECLFLVDNIMKEALDRKTMDNISVILISFKQIHLNWMGAESPTRKNKNISSKSQKQPNQEEIKIIYNMLPIRDLTDSISPPASAGGAHFLRKRPSRTFFFGDKKEIEKIEIIANQTPVLETKIFKSQANLDTIFKRNIKTSRKVPI